MAIAEIKKIEIIGLERDKEDLLVLLQELGIVEVLNVQQEPGVAYQAQLASADARLLEIEETVSFFASFQERAGLLEGLIKLKPLVYERELNEVISDFDYRSLLNKVSNLRNELNNLLHEKERLAQERLLLMPWRGLGLTLDEIHPTENCGIFLGVLNNRHYSSLKGELEKENIKLFIEVANKDKINLYLLILYIKHDFERLQTALKNHHFNFIVLPKSGSTVKDKLLDINSKTLILDDQIQDIKNEIIELSKERFKLMVIYDYLANVARRRDADKILTKQQFTFSLCGWIRRNDIRLLERRTSGKLKDAAIFISDPRPDEDVPTALENAPVIRPFEVVTNLYGQPIRSGLDPTGFLAPFFAISFGFCILDAGYGLILLLISLFFLKKRQISEHAKNFFRFFRYLGVATIIAGLVTGNFFGDLISRMPELLAAIKNIQRTLTLFNPVENSLMFLGFTLMIGFAQIWTGVFIRFTRNLRRNRFAAFILDLPTLLVQTSLLMLVLIFFKFLPVSMLKYTIVSLSVSALMVIFYQIKANRQLSLKIFWSIFGIYSIITGNFLADTLSFSRIFALGLTGSLLGMAINTMLFPKGPINSFFALLAMAIAALVMFLGHILNLGICTLGAYVHTSRLQYLEFFTKFFESGGRPFRSFRKENKYTFWLKDGQEMEV